MCVCVCARARVCVCVCVCEQLVLPESLLDCLKQPLEYSTMHCLLLLDMC